MICISSVLRLFLAKFNGKFSTFKLRVSMADLNEATNAVDTVLVSHKKRPSNVSNASYSTRGLDSMPLEDDQFGSIWTN